MSLISLSFGNLSNNNCYDHFMLIFMLMLLLLQMFSQKVDIVISLRRRLPLEFLTPFPFRLLKNGLADRRGFSTANHERVFLKPQAGH